MIDQGAEYFVVSAAFTVPTGEAHWDLLLRARAVENLCHLVASAQVGEHENGRRTLGHSAVVDCWGQGSAELPAGEGVAIGEMDLARQAEVRREFPALEHRVLGRTSALKESWTHEHDDRQPEPRAHAPSLRPAAWTTVDWIARWRW